MTAMQEQSLAELAERIDDLELPFMRAVQFAQGYLTLLAERDALKAQLVATQNKLNVFIRAQNAELFDVGEVGP